ncbi:DoxX family protein [Arenibacter echinorum]|uniref:Putative membrane protein n=1 Tax=Arenibacter echinorum TaxID=440515 RepID=A0A327RCA8_9FLAO|nr:DoxX family protein [Arenibacter echinorum]RAJ13818.1 putative membrane protein [Arenibacter echinorum]
MKPLIVLLASFLIALLVLYFRLKQIKWQLAGQIAMAAMLLFTSLGHFMFTEGMTAMMPEFMPLKKEMVYVTGVLEILFAIGLLIPRLKILTAWLLMLFFILILPANIKAAVENINYQTGELNGNGIEYLWFRVPLQIFFILWVYFTTLKKYNSA